MELRDDAVSNYGRFGKIGPLHPSDTTLTFNRSWDYRHRSQAYGHQAGGIRLRRLLALAITVHSEILLVVSRLIDEWSDVNELAPPRQPVPPTLSPFQVNSSDSPDGAAPEASVQGAEPGVTGVDRTVSPAASRWRDALRRF